MAVRNDIDGETISDIVNFSSAIDGQAYIVLGQSTKGDRSARLYYYDVASTATADGDNVLAATGMGGTGRFIKLPFENTSSGVTSVGLSSSDFTISGSPITTSGTITLNLSTTGITAGSYGIVTIDSKGRATAGKRTETYSGTTDGSGNYTVTFGTSYSTAPNIVASIVGGSNTNLYKITSISTTGFTVNVVNRTDVIGLLPSYSVVSGASVNVLITEK